MKFKLIIILFAFFACQAEQTKKEEIPPSYLKNYSIQQLIEDAKLLREELIKYHAGIYRYTSEDELEYSFKEVIGNLNREMNALSFLRIIAPYIAKINCGHTRYSLPVNVKEAIYENEKFLPVRVGITSGKVYITEFLGDSRLEAGQEILSINGHSISEIKKTVFESLPSDGFIETSKYRFWESNFSYLYALFIETGKEQFMIKTEDGSGERIIEIKGTKYENLLKPKGNGPILSLDKIEVKTSLMRIGTFSSGLISQRGQDYYDFLEESFQALRNKKVKNLIIDLRGNGGGDDNYGAKLISYLSPSPFKYFESIEVTASYDGWGIIEEQNGKRLMTSHQALNIQQPEDNNYKGEVYLLVDGFSFSTCADVATVAHYLKLATIIGEETGGGYDGNTSGYSRSLILPNIGINIHIPMWKYTTANIGHKYYGRGVMPDFKVEPTVDQLLRGEDVVLEFVKNKILQHTH